MRDLVLTGGRIIDPATGRDETADIAFGDGKVTEVGHDLTVGDAKIVDVRGLVVVPGLIDLHTIPPSAQQLEPQFVDRLEPIEAKKVVPARQTAHPHRSPR